MPSSEKKSSKTIPPPEGHVRVTVNVPIALKEQIKMAQLAYPTLPKTVAGIVLEALEQYLTPYQPGIQRLQKAKNDKAG